MDFQHAWEIFSKVVMPLLAAYAAYLHKVIGDVMNKTAALERALYDHKVEVTKTFVTQEALGVLDAKIARMLERIDDKVTRILEEKH